MIVLIILACILLFLGICAIAHYDEGLPGIMASIALKLIGWVVLLVVFAAAIAAVYVSTRIG